MNIKKLNVRGLNYHIQEWGNPTKPLLFLLHGWMDCGASFKFIAEYLKDDFFLVAPDWRGFGETDHVRSGYWFADYYADLECILKEYSPDKTVNLVGHSARWLDEIAPEQETKIYPNIEVLKESIRIVNPSLSDKIVNELTSLWARPYGEFGEMQLKHDHAHRIASPLRYNFQDVLATWQQVTADAAIVMAEDSSFYRRYLRLGRIDEAVANLPMTKDDVFLIQNAAHMLQLEQPQAVAAAIFNYFGRK